MGGNRVLMVPGLHTTGKAKTLGEVIPFLTLQLIYCSLINMLLTDIVIPPWISPSQGEPRKRARMLKVLYPSSLILTSSARAREHSIKLLHKFALRAVIGSSGANKYPQCFAPSPEDGEENTLAVR